MAARTTYRLPASKTSDLPIVKESEEKDRRLLFARHRCNYSRAGANLRNDGKRSPKYLDTLLHAQETEGLSPIAGRRRHADTVVGDLDGNRVSRANQGDSDTARLCMTTNIDQGFLKYAVQRRHSHLVQCNWGIA